MVLLYLVQKYFSNTYWFKVEMIMGALNVKSG